MFIKKRAWESWWDRKARKRWLSWRKREIMWKALSKFIIEEDGRTLDVGCGVGLIYPYLKGKVEYVGVDFTQKFLEDARELFPEIDVRYGTALNLPFEDNNFNTSFCAHLLEHIHPDDVAKAINEMLRVAEKKSFYSWFKPPIPKYRNQIEYRDYITVNYNLQFIQDIFNENPKFKKMTIHRIGRRIGIYEVEHYSSSG